MKREKWIPFILSIIHLAVFLIPGITESYSLFSFLLLFFSFATVFTALRKKMDPFLPSAFIIIFLSHEIAGHRLAPDSLTSGAILVTNLLVVYTGFKIFTHKTFHHALSFTTGYLVLFFLFIISMDNAEALFLIALLGLCGTAVNLRLTAFFWALVISFTFAQPYAWETAIISLISLKIIFTAKDRNADTAVLVFLGTGLTLVFFLLFPVIFMLLGEDTRNIISILSKSNVQEALITTAITATVSTLLLCLVGIPFSWALARSRFFGRDFMMSAIDIPIIVPHSAAGIAILSVFSRRQPFGQGFHALTGLQIDGTILGICLVQLFVSMPFLVRSCTSAFEAVPRRLENSAATLGASPLKIFFTISLPLAARGVFAGIILSWARAAGEFGALLLVAPTPETAPVEIFNRFTALGLRETTPLVSTVILFSLSLFFLLQYSTRKLYRPENIR